MAAKKVPGEGILDAALAALRERASQATLDGMARYAIPSDHAFGVAMRDVQAVAKSLGKNHPLAAELWASGWYEARLLACYVDDPAAVTAKQMDDWCRDFDNWAIVDTLCFHLFDRTPHAWLKVEQWGKRREEFVKRGAFALIASLALHDKTTGDERFLRALSLVERASDDDRNFVKKGVSWALRVVGRRSARLNAAAVTTARRLAESDEPAARWIGRGALEELTSPAVRRRAASRKKGVRG
jgi:3-methyladenine DNA glycosylase AlkD